MSTDNLLRTYGDQSIKEDVLDLVELLSAQEDGLMNVYGRSTAHAMVHQWLVDTLSTTADVLEEGAQFSASALTTPTRSTNVVEYVGVDFGVTDAQRAVNHYGFEDEFSYQTEKALKTLLNKVEADLLRSSLVSGASGTPPRMIGTINCISTNKTSHTSGTVFNQSILDGLLAIGWDNGNGEPVTDVFVGQVLKRRISQFSGRSGTQFVIQADEEQLVTTTSGYTSDFGDCKIHLHRYMQKDYTGSSDATGRVLGVNRSKFKVTYLEGMGPTVEQFARRGATTDARASAMVTLESLNERNSFFADGFLLSP